MPCTHRLPAVRLCLLFLAALLAHAASADPSRVAAAALPTTGLSVPAAQPTSKRRANHSEASPARQAECAAATRASKHRRARKACLPKKATAKGTNPSTPPRSAGTTPAHSSALAFAIVESPLVEALAVPAPESTPPAESLGSSDKPPVEPIPPVELKTPIEPIPPLEASNPPVEEPKAPVEAPPTQKTSTTTTLLAASINPSMIRQPVTYTAAVSPAAATGTVAFGEAGTPIAGCTAQPVGSGTATCTLPGYATAGQHAITATYSGDGDYLTSASSSSTQMVETPGTTNATLTLASSLNPSTVGEAVTYTTTLNTTAATGTVEFKQAGVTIAGCVAQVISSGTATCTAAGLTTGGHWTTAVYSGDRTYAASTSPSLGQTVNKKGTTMTLSSSLNPSTVGEATTYTATLNTTATTGTVEFRQAGVTIPGCAAQPISAGNAQCTVVNSSSGWRLVTAIYSGDGSYATSTSSPGLGQSVNKKLITIRLSSSLNPSTAGEAPTYTATVSPAAATGSVEFRQAGVAIAGCSAQTVNAGTATCTVNNLAAGTHWIAAVYSGDSSYATLLSPGITQTVNKKTTTTMVSSSSNPSTVGEALTYTATVSPAAATGTVEFKRAGVTISGCAAQAVSSGTATCTVAKLAVGWYGITAVYSGDSNHSSTFAGLTQTVNKKATTTTVSSLVDPSTVGQAVTYKAAVSPATTTGTVDFREEGAPIVGCTAEIISSGTATCTVAGYRTWSSYRITAAYGGDNSDLASASSIFTQTVEPSVESAAPLRFFSPTSFWNKELPTDALLDPSSVAVVGALDEEVTMEEEKNNGPVILTTEWSVPIYTVPAEQPTVKVTLESASKTPTLQAAWDAVPLPPNAAPAAGNDKHLVVWQPNTNKLWEFWHLEKTDEGWQADWGGAIQNVSSDSGAYGPEAWPGAQPVWGASGSSLSIAGGLITLEDLEKGEINHALAMALPDTRAGVYASPAQRTDGANTTSSSLPEGAHLRLEPGLNLASLHLPKLTLLVAEAAQKYGIFVRDSAANVAFYAQDPTPTATNPYAGVHGYDEGKSVSQILAAFPWSHLQLLKMELHTAP